MRELTGRICRALPGAAVLEDAPMKHYTTMRVGGPADILLDAASEEEVITAVAICRQAGAPYWVMGNGSNLIVGDKGIRALVIHIGKRMAAVYAEGDTLFAQAGASMMQTVRAAHTLGLTGLEFAGGIPGTVGGAVTMNAGAYGGEIKQKLLTAAVLLPNGDTAVWDCEALGFGHRISRLQNGGGVCLNARFRLERGDVEQARALLADLMRRRREKQPLQYPSAGSVFKRPEGHFASQLIDQAGLKGLRVGDAEVSCMHAGFIINRANATAADVVALIRLIQQKVQERFGVTLEPEVRLIGEF